MQLKPQLLAALFSAAGLRLISESDRQCQCSHQRKGKQAKFQVDHPLVGGTVAPEARGLGLR